MGPPLPAALLPVHRLHGCSRLLGASSRLALFAFLCLFSGVLALPLPKDGSPCPINRNDLEECIAKNLNFYIPLLANGDDKVIPDLDPLLIPSAESSYEDGNMTMSLRLKDVVLRGVSKTAVFRVRAKSLEEGKIEVICKTPTIIATGTYSSEGAVISFPLHSHGPFNLTLGDLTTHIVVNLESISGHIQVSHLGLNVMPSLIDIQAGRQLDDDNSLGVTLNVYLNENSLELYNLVRPKLMDYFSSIIRDVINTLLWEAGEGDVFPNLSLR